MKRLFPYTLALLSATMFSCGNKNNVNEDQNKADSIAAAQAAADSIAAAGARWEADSQRFANQHTPDLEYMELHGPVKSLTTTEPTTRYDYSRTGQLLLVDGYNPFTENPVELERMCLKRNSKGEINSYVMYESSEDYEWKHGKLTIVDGGGEGYEWHLTYSYDDKGMLRSKKGYQEFNDGSEHENINIEYTYLDYDKYGNWTRRKSSGGIEKRTIKYFNITRPSDNADDFDPTVRTYDFRGKIGGEKNCPLQISKDGGYYVVASGKKTLVFSDYDAKTTELTIDAFKPDGVKFIGRFVGKVTGKTYKGVFTNDKGGKVNFDLEME